MKLINNYIIEKLKISKDSKGIDQNFKKFCHELYLNDSKNNHDDLEELYNLYKNDCENIIDKNFDGQLLSTNFELIFMIVVMLLDDDLHYSSLEKIGTTSYNGSNNPYDFSWFEEEDSNGRTVLEIMQDLYQTPKTNPRFIEIYLKIYETVSKACTSYKNAIEGIWELHDNI